MNTSKCNTLLINFKENGINNDSTQPAFQSVLDFQDVIGQSTMSDMFDYYHALEIPVRHTFIWACSTCLAMDTFLEIIRMVVCQSVIIAEEERLYKQYNDKAESVTRESTELHESKRTIYKKLRELNSSVEYFTERTSHFRTLYQQEATKREQAQKDATKYRQIKNLLS